MPIVVELLVVGLGKLVLGWVVLLTSCSLRRVLSQLAFNHQPDLVLKVVLR